MRTISLAALTAALLGCSPAVAPGPPGDPQEQALAALESDTGVTWSVRYHEDVHTPAFLDGRTAPLAAHPSQAAAAARGFLSTYRALFKLGSASDELALDDSSTDELGMTHARFTQVRSGVPVWGAELTAHFDPEGALTTVHGRYEPIDAIDAAPVVTPDGARAAVSARLAAAHPDATLETANPLLVIDPGPWPRPSGTIARLAWRVEVRVYDAAAPARVELFVDARTGEVYRSADLLASLEGSGIGVLGETEPLSITEKRGRFYLEFVPSTGAAQRTDSAAGGTKLPGSEVSSDRPDRWDASGAGAGSAVDAHAFVAAAHAYYASTHGRDGWKGNGDGMRATVHFGRGFANAFFDGKQLVFGDGDGQTLLAPAGALDVVAHEFTHGVTETSSRLGMSGESGALNEGISDLFGCFVEHAVRGTRANWRVGDDVYLGGGHGLRDLAEPHRTNNPEHASEWVDTSDDNGGVHVNSTIVSHAGYLISEGGSNGVSHLRVTGVGLAAAQRIWYRALTRYLHPRSGVRDAADATITAARDLYGKGTQVDRVRAAWQAMGVL
jgi:Zn-dependent metalloprotease